MSATPAFDEPLGEGVLVDREGTPAVTDLTWQDRFVLARLQDVEDHPDLWLEDAA